MLQSKPWSVSSYLRDSRSLSVARVSVARALPWMLEGRGGRGGFRYSTDHTLVRVLLLFIFARNVNYFPWQGMLAGMEAFLLTCLIAVNMSDNVLLNILATCTTHSSCSIPTPQTTLV